MGNKTQIPVKKYLFPVLLKRVDKLDLLYNTLVGSLPYKGLLLLCIIKRSYKSLRISLKDERKFPPAFTKVLRCQWKPTDSQIPILYLRRENLVRWRSQKSGNGSKARAGVSSLSPAAVNGPLLDLSLQVSEQSTMAFISDACGERECKGNTHPKVGHEVCMTALHFHAIWNQTGQGG